jgi:hypothetical protein
MKLKPLDAPRSCRATLRSMGVRHEPWHLRQIRSPGGPLTRLLVARTIARLAARRSGA